jgi:hypothetical protein
MLIWISPSASRVQRAGRRTRRVELKVRREPIISLTVAAGTLLGAIVAALFAGAIEAALPGAGGGFVVALVLSPAVRAIRMDIIAKSIEREWGAGWRFHDDVEDDGDARRRRSALEKIAALGPMAAPSTPLVIQRLIDRDMSVRAAAAIALGAIAWSMREHAQLAIGALRTNMPDASQVELRSAFAAALARLEPVGAQPAGNVPVPAAPVMYAYPPPLQPQPQPAPQLWQQIASVQQPPMQSLAIAGAPAMYAYPPPLQPQPQPYTAPQPWQQMASVQQPHAQSPAGAQCQRCGLWTRWVSPQQRWWCDRCGWL